MGASLRNRLTDAALRHKTHVHEQLDTVSKRALDLAFRSVHIKQRHDNFFKASAIEPELP